MQSKTPASQLPDTAAMFEALGKDLSRSPIMDHYATRHAIKTAPNLTIRDDEIAHLTASYMHDRIAGKTVVEIGGGLGLLALHLGFSAQRVFCIEANPIWAATFTETLLQHKPKNVSYLFGSADWPYPRQCRNFLLTFRHFGSHTACQTIRTHGDRCMERNHFSKSREV